MPSPTLSMWPRAWLSVGLRKQAGSAFRAARRAAQDADSVHGTAGVAATEESLRRRDELDTTRASSPLRMAEDAHLVDATELDLDATISAVCAIVTQALGEPT